jgi:MATE family multidrug resistance protein
VAYLLVALPLGYLLGIRWGYGPTGIWAGLAVGLAAAALMLGLRFMRLTAGEIRHESSPQRRAN